jgi:hypothetical protein
MTLRDIVVRLADLVDLEVIVGDGENVVEKCTDMNIIKLYEDCKVEIIDTTEDGTLVVTVNGNTEE